MHPTSLKGVFWNAAKNAQYISFHICENYFSKIVLFRAKHGDNKISTSMYDRRLKYKWDNKNVLDYAVKEAVDEVSEQERIKALEEKKAMAREMKNYGLPDAQISKYTKLRAEEIEEL